MTIKDIGNLPCKIGKTAITVYDAETGKKCGMVRNVYVAGKENQPRRILEFRQRHNSLPLSMRMRSIEVEGSGYYVVNTGNLHNDDLSPVDLIDYEVRMSDEIASAGKYGLEILKLNLV